MLSIYRLPQYAVSALLFLFAAVAPAPAQDCREKLATQLMEPVGSPPDALRARRDCPLGASDQGSERENKLSCRTVFHILDVGK